MSLVVRHIALPAVAPLALLALYYTPLTVVGCAERGLLALAVTAVAAVAAFGCIVMAFRARREETTGRAGGCSRPPSSRCRWPLLLGPLG